MVQNIGLTWAGTQCVNPKARVQLMEHLAATSEHHRDCSALIGRALTRRGRPYLVHSVSGECFVFELSQGQAGQLEIQDNMLVRIVGHEREERGVPPPRLVSLETLSIKHNSVVRQSQPITGTLRFSTLTSYPFPLAIRLSYDVPDGPWVSRRFHRPSRTVLPALRSNPVRRSPVVGADQ